MTTILIVEDNEINMRLFSDLLKAKGYNTVECLEGIHALETARSVLPDLIIMDIQMPEISGLIVTQMIRKDPVLCKTPIVAVSAFAMQGDEERILAVGCDAYVSKPISIPVFLKTIEDNLKK